MTVDHRLGWWATAALVAVLLLWGASGRRSVSLPHVDAGERTAEITSVALPPPPSPLVPRSRKPAAAIAAEAAEPPRAASEGAHEPDASVGGARAQASRRPGPWRAGGGAGIGALPPALPLGALLEPPADPPDAAYGPLAMAPPRAEGGEGSAMHEGGGAAEQEGRAALRTVHERWAHEPRDGRWTEAMASYLATTLSDLQVEGELEGTDCGETICRVGLRFSDADEAMRFREEAGEDGRNLTIDLDANDQGIVVGVYLERDEWDIE